VNRANTVAIASLTQTSIGPKCSSTASAAASTSAGHIRRQHDGFAAERLDLAFRAVEPPLTSRDQPDTGAALGECVRDGAADTARRTGDDDDLATSLLVHRFSFRPHVNLGYRELPAPPERGSSRACRRLHHTVVRASEAQ
jgi:hypothetical protein